MNSIQIKEVFGDMAAGNILKHTILELDVHRERWGRERMKREKKENILKRRKRRSRKIEWTEKRHYRICFMLNKLLRCLYYAWIIIKIPVYHRVSWKFNNNFLFFVHYGCKTINERSFRYRWIKWDFPPPPFNCIWFKYLP